MHGGYQVRDYDKLNIHEDAFKKQVDKFRDIGYGRMIQIIQYTWTDFMMEERMFKHLNNYDKELAASKRGSGETDWKMDNIKALEEENEKLNTEISRLRDNFQFFKGMLSDSEELKAIAKKMDELQRFNI